MAAVLKSRAGCSSGLRCSTSRKSVVAVRAAADNQLLKKPELKRPDTPAQPKKLFDDGTAASSSAPSSPEVVTSSKVVTIEYQRQRAKEMRQYFLDVKNEKLQAESRVFGWIPKNEISNGRWVMFGFAVGLLTEYATGVDFPDQIKLLVSYLGIVDTD